MADQPPALGPRGVTGRVMINGRVIQGREFDEFCERTGKCKICGKVTVKKKTGLFGALTDIPVETDARGRIVVYKGYHLGPRCYSLKQAKQELGETDESAKKKSDKKPKSTRFRDETSTSRLQDTNGGSRVDRKPDAVDWQKRSSGSRWSLTSSDRSDRERKMGSPQNSSSKLSDTSSESLPASLTTTQEPPPERKKPPSKSLEDNSRTSPERRKDYGRARSSITTGCGVRFDAGHNRAASFDEKHGDLAAVRREFQSTPNLAVAQKPDVCFPPSSLQQTLPEESPEEKAILELEDDVSRRDTHDFLLHMGFHREESEVLRRGLQLMRETVYDIHRAFPKNKHIWPQDSWCKTIKSAMSDFKHDREIQEEGALTVAFTSDFSTKYRLDLVSNCNASEVIAAMEEHHALSEICCVALESLTRTERLSVSWREEHVGQAVEALKDLLSDHPRSGKDWAILTLHNISCDTKLAKAFVDQQMRSIFLSSGVMNAFVNVIQDDTVAETVVEAAVSLLWRFWACPKDASGDSLTGPTASEGLLGALVGAMYNFGSESLHEASCGLLSVVQIPSSVEPEGSSFKTLLIEAVWNSLTRHTIVEAVQLLGLKALCNLFSDPIRDDSVSDLELIVESIVFTMNNFGQNADLQAHGCQALARIFADGDSIKDAAPRKGAINVITTALRTHVVNAANLEENEQTLGNLKEWASAALASLAHCSDAIPMLRDSDLILDFQTIIEREEVPPEGSSVRACAVNLIATAFGGGSSIDSEARNSVRSKLATQLVFTTNKEAEVESLIGSLYAMSCFTPSILDIVISAASGTGIALLVGLMQEYPENVSIQESGCGILANSYCRVPFEGQLDQLSDLVVGVEPFTVTTHSSSEVDVLRSAIVKHRAKVGVVMNACAALCNFVSSSIGDATDPDDAHFSEKSVSLYSGVTKEAESAMSLHEENLEALRSLLRLVQLAVAFIGQDELKECSDTFVPKISKTVLRFSQDKEMQDISSFVLSKLESTSADSTTVDSSSQEPGESQNGQPALHPRVNEGHGADEHWEESGMCPICGKVQVKEATKVLQAGRLVQTWRDIPFKTDDDEIIVYKGCCLGPNCYTLQQAMRELGELDDTSDDNGKANEMNSTSARTPTKPPPQAFEPSDDNGKVGTENSTPTRTGVKPLKLGREPSGDYFGLIYEDAFTDDVEPDQPVANEPVIYEDNAAEHPADQQNPRGSLASAQFEELCERHGLCHRCGDVRVKVQDEQSGQWTAVPIEVNQEGEITVYKGYCLGPQCYKLDEAKRALGEIGAGSRVWGSRSRNNLLDDQPDDHPDSFTSRRGSSRSRRNLVDETSPDDRPDPVNRSSDSGRRDVIIEEDITSVVSDAATAGYSRGDYREAGNEEKPRTTRSSWYY